MADPITMTLVAGAAVTAVGTLVGGEMSASATEKAGGLRAQQLGQAAAESRAASQRDSFEKQREARLALSTLTSRAAASGSGNDTDTAKLSGDIERRGEYLSLASLYTGENRARGLLDEADATKWQANTSAKATRVGSYFAAAGSILKGVGAAAGGPPGAGAGSSSSLGGGPIDLRYDPEVQY